LKKPVAVKSAAQQVILRDLPMKIWEIVVNRPICPIQVLLAIARLVFGFLHDFIGNKKRQFWAKFGTLFSIGG